MDIQSINKVGFDFLSGMLFGGGAISILFGLYNIYDFNVNGNVNSKYWYYLITGVCSIFASRQISNKKHISSH